ncbi:MAG: hypothetical protein Q9220_006534 [cf. Caloplaca sp. 1 TL-2023]
MPPIRRYLRITQYSVLECRIYLDTPADAQRWLLNVRSPVLPRVIEAVRPLVLPKLREENARAKSGKGGKKKGWKDVVVEGTVPKISSPWRAQVLMQSSEDFEVAIFLTEISSRHAILHKEKQAKTEKPKLGTGIARLTAEGTRDVPVEVEDSTEAPIRREETGDEELLDLADIPAASDRRAQKATAPGTSLFVNDSSDDEADDDLLETTAKSDQPSDALSTSDPSKDEKKKLAMRTLYDGFSIYGRILCLVVKRRGYAKSKDLAGGAGQAMMEEWIASTQMADAQTADE